MAAAGSSSNKNLNSSCSPVPARPTNPVSRNSEISNPMRRSFSGTPFAKPSIVANRRSGFNPSTPNCSPSDNPRRHSTSRENWDSRVSLRDQEKENRNNDHSLKHARIRSPSPSRGTKHFMSPTISAASKVNESARKKILAERSELVRSSISFDDAKSLGMEDLELKSEKGMDQKKDGLSGTVMEELESKFEEGVPKKKEVSFDSTVTVIEVENSKEEDTDNKEELDVGYDCVNLDPSFKISPKAVSYFPSPALAPLDADPSVPPPYDPKTNYLSPRPVFLHYRPNPRIGDGKRLEETFTSECLPDASEEESLSQDSQKESEDASSCDQSMVEDGEQEKGEEEEGEDSSNMSEGMVGIRKRTNSPFITRGKLAALVLALAAVFMYGSFANPPIVDPSVLHHLSFPELQIPPQITEFTRQSFTYKQKFQSWFVHTLSSTRDMMNNLRERPEIGPLQYVNLTMLEDGSADVFDSNALGAGMNYGITFFEHVEEGEVDDGEDKLVESFEGIGESVESCDDSDEFVDGDDQESEEQEIAPFDDNVEIPVEHEEDVVEEAEYTAIATIFDEAPATVQVLEDESVTISQIAEIHPEVADSRQLRSTDEPSSELLVTEPNALVLQTAETQLQVHDTVQLPLSSEFLGIEPVAPILQTSETEPEAAEEVDSASDTKYFVVEEADSRQLWSTDEPSIELLVIEPNAPVLQTAETHLEIHDTVQLPLSSEFLVNEPVAPVLQTSEIEPDAAEEVDSASDTKNFAVESVQESLVLDEKISAPLSTLGKLLLSGIAVVLCFVCIRSINAPDNNSHLVSQYQLLERMNKTLERTTTANNRPISAENSLQDEPNSRTLATEVDMIGQSCPSEMSSYQNSLCYSKKGLKDTKTRAYSSTKTQDTQQNNHRRESSSSSDYSTSYGSFTTYERIHMKQGNADEEVMITPVRRSSRIRKQVTSPVTQT